MLTYTKGCGGCFILFRIVGVSWPMAIIPGLISALLGQLLGSIKAVNDVISDKEKWVDNPYPLQLYVYMVAILLIARTNYAYLRYWESLDAVQRMAAKWHDAMCMTVSFDSPGNSTMPYLSGYNWTLRKPDGPAGPRFENFFNEMVHLFSLMHGLALLHLRGDSDLGNLLDYYDLPLKADRQYCISEVGNQPDCGVLIRPNTARSIEDPDGRPRRRNSMVENVQLGLTNIARFSPKHLDVQMKMRKLRILGKISESEYGLLDKTASGETVSTLARVGMVESWIMRRWIARQKHEPMGDTCKTSPPILSRLYQIISDGNLAFSQACKAAEVPFPFPYQNLLRLFLWILTIVIPFFVNSQVYNMYARLAVNFMAVFAYFSLCEVGDNLEDPFLPYDPNELPLQVLQHTFNTRLLAMGILPKGKPEPEEAPEQIKDPVGVAAGAALANPPTNAPVKTPPHAKEAVEAAPGPVNDPAGVAAGATLVVPPTDTPAKTPADAKEDLGSLADMSPGAISATDTELNETICKPAQTAVVSVEDPITTQEEALNLQPTPRSEKTMSRTVDVRCAPNWCMQDPRFDCCMQH